MLKPFIALFALIVLTLSPSAGAPTQDRSDQPPAQPVGPIPPVYYDSLLNGLQILIVERPDEPEVTIGFMINRGGAFDLAGREGTADLTARLVMRGSQPVADKPLAQQFQDLDVEADFSVTLDATRFLVQAPPKNLPQLFPVLAAILTRSEFPDADVAALKQQRLDELRQRPPSSLTLTDREFSRWVFARHPYARPLEGTPESIRSITAADIERHYRRFYQANNAMLTVVGNVSSQALMPLIRPTFGALRRGQPAPSTFTAPAKPNGIHIKVIDQADQADAHLRIGYLAVPRAHDDFIPLLLLNAALGGTNHSPLARLASAFAPERVTLASQLDAGALAGSFSISASAPSRLAPVVISALLKFVESIRTDGISPSDLAAAKSYLTANLPGRVRTNRQIVEQLQEIELYGLGRDYLHAFAQRVERVTPEQVKQAAAEYLSTTNLYIVVAGPAASLVEELKKLGTVEVVR